MTTTSSLDNQADTFTSPLTRDKDGALYIDGVAIEDICRRFGTPTFVMSESTITSAYARFRSAFTARYPGDVTVLYGLKSNNLLAVAAHLAKLGCGADCFGLAELHIAEKASFPPEALWLQGSNKTDAELEAAVRVGAVVNVDSADEAERLDGIIRERHLPRARVAFRVRLPLEELDDVIVTDWRYSPPEVPLGSFVRTSKFGMSPEDVIDLVNWVQRSRSLQAVGLHFHLKSQTTDPSLYRRAIRAYADAISTISAATRWQPSAINVGGGYPIARSQGYGPAGNDTEVPPIEEFADAIASTLVEGIGTEFRTLPELVLEPGRYLVGQAGILLATVGTVKRDYETPWIHVDASINQLSKISSANWVYSVVTAGKLNEASARASIAGPLCNAADVLAHDVAVPDLERGDRVVFLDAGAYAQAYESQANSQPRSAGVWVSKGEAFLVRGRELPSAVIQRDSLPGGELSDANNKSA